MQWPTLSTGLHSVAAAALDCGAPGSTDTQLSASPCVALLDAVNWLDGEGPGRGVLVPGERGVRVVQWATDGTACAPEDSAQQRDDERAVRVLKTTYQQVGQSQLSVLRQCLVWCLMH